MKRTWIAGLVFIAALGLVACGGGGEETAVDDLADIGAADEGTTTTPLPKNIPKNPPEEPTELATPPPGAYVTEHDPDATYTYADITMEGSYLKLNLEDLTDTQMNSVVHRLRTEYCTCGCPKDTIDMCLINDPNCSTAVTLAKQIIREERLKS